MAVMCYKIAVKTELANTNPLLLSSSAAAAAAGSVERQVIGVVVLRLGYHDLRG